MIAQSPLSPLEEGLHAVGSGMKVSEYAKKVGKGDTAIAQRWRAAKVAQCVHVNTLHSDHWRALSEFHVTKDWLWPALVAALPMTVAQHPQSPVA